jgi:hypothetical protein
MGVLAYPRPVQNRLFGLEKQVCAKLHNWAFAV